MYSTIVVPLLLTIECVNIFIMLVSRSVRSNIAGISMVQKNIAILCEYLLS